LFYSASSQARCFTTEQGNLPPEAERSVRGGTPLDCLKVYKTRGGNVTRREKRASNARFLKTYGFSFRFLPKWSLE
jgi:hypothetical protein